MRKLRRSIARAKMQAEGVQHMNRKQLLPNGQRGRSFFAENWKKYAGGAR